MLHDYLLPRLDIVLESLRLSASFVEETHDMHACSSHAHTKFLEAIFGSLSNCRFNALEFWHNFLQAFSAGSSHARQKVLFM